MTYPTDEELDALVRDVAIDAVSSEIDRVLAGRVIRAITALRAQLAEVQRELDVANACNRGLVRLNEATEARADRAEAALAAQIEVDAGIADDFHRRAIEWAEKVKWFEKHIDETDSSRIAAAIRNQPRAGAAEHGSYDRTALDRMLTEAREQALREAIEAYPKGVGAILALIENKEKS